MLVRSFNGVIQAIRFVESDSTPQNISAFYSLQNDLYFVNIFTTIRNENKDGTDTMFSQPFIRVATEHDNLFMIHFFLNSGNREAQNQRQVLIIIHSFSIDEHFLFARSFSCYWRDGKNKIHLYGVMVIVRLM